MFGIGDVELNSGPPGVEMAVGESRAVQGNLFGGDDEAAAPAAKPQAVSWEQMR